MAGLGDQKKQLNRQYPSYSQVKNNSYQAKQGDSQVSNFNLYNQYMASFISDRLNSNNLDSSALLTDDKNQNLKENINTSEYLQNVEVVFHDHTIASKLDKSKYFNEQASTLFEEESSKTAKGAPTAYLVDPYARKGTSKSKFNLAPCSGGILGTSRSLASPGEKTNVQWIIQNPVKGGKCKVSLAKGHPDDLGSYQTLVVNDPSYNARTGQFD